MNAPVRTNKAMPAESAEEAPPGVDAGLPVDGALTTPREIVIYLEGFGAGPGGGWFLELSFLALNDDEFSVFLCCDGTLDDDLLGEEPVCEDVSHEDGSWDVEIRARRIATVAKPLNWRRALRFTRSLDSIRLGGEDASEVRVSGVPPWQKAVLTHALIRRPRAPNLSAFFSGLLDTDLQGLHERLGGLLSKKASKILSGLAKAMRGAGLRKQSLQQIAEIVGVADPWNLKALTAAVEEYRMDRGSGSEHRT